MSTLPRNEINMTTHDRNNHAERIGRLETSVEGLHQEFSEVKLSLKAIQDAVGKSKETDWGVVFSGIGLIVVLYAAAIRPMQNDLDRVSATIALHESKELVNAKDLRDDLALKDTLLATQRADFVRQEELVRSLKEKLDHVEERGSPIADKRLTLLELQLGQLLEQAKKP